MKKLFLLLVFILSLAQLSFATHQRAAEITFRHISGLTYEATITSYTYSPSLADRPQLEIQWGDGTTSILNRTNGPAGINPAGVYCVHLGEMVATDIKKNLYVGQHTYSGAATYKIALEDPNRNYGILNIPNSVDIPMYVETELTINPFIGYDNSPQLTLPPIDQGCVNQPYVHNPGAYDPDGDSLSYKLTICRYTGGAFIPGYKLPNLVDPNHPGTFTMNPVTGEIRWLNPTLQGEYNIAFLIEEWRNGVRIGYVTRDMQITIVSCQNHPPVIKPPKDTCVLAGDTAKVNISATDQDNNNITLTLTGAPFLESPNPAVFAVTSQGSGYTNGTITWVTSCSEVQKNPYPIYIKASDNAVPVSLTDLESFNITVIGPKTTGLAATPLGNSIKLTWNQNTCSNVSGYKIYRRNGYYGFKPGPCETGVPAYTGYSQVGSVNSNTTTIYSDDNSGKGLSHGVDYCYMIVAVYPDGAESIASSEVCTRLKKDLPIITNVTIDKTGTTDGVARVIWSKPTEIDTVAAPGPYKYLLYRSFNYDGSNAVLIDSLPSLNDTIYSSININTKDNPVCYRIDLYNIATGNRFKIGSSESASSDYLTLAPGDKKMRMTFNYQVPWLNYHFVIYRQNPQTTLFDSIGQSDVNSYVDLGLVNGTSYCYRVKSIGTYSTPGINDPLINWSQINCSTTVDNEPPCPPVLQVGFDCKQRGNVLVWNNPNHSCAHDVAKYYIYYGKGTSHQLALLDSVHNANDTVYIHKNLVSVLGCYAVMAIDSAGNKSIMSDTACVTIDTCGRYHLPNVFSPNNDGHNDYLVPFPYIGVQKINLLIYNRWGRLIFKTTDPDIKWDGKIMGTDQPASDGVYYYVCDVYEDSGEGIKVRTIKGSITIIR